MARMNRRARRPLLLTLAATLLVTLVAVWLLWPRTAITRENAEKIRPGMTLAEVEAILGGPARDESTGPPASDLSEALEAYDRPGRLKWQSDHVVMWLNLDAAGNVGQVSTVPVRRADESTLDRFRRWLGL
jgi:hypothetical protein